MASSNGKHGFADAGSISSKYTAHIWVIDPVSREGFDCSTENWLPTRTFVVKDLAIQMAIAELDLPGQVAIADLDLPG